MRAAASTRSPAPDGSGPVEIQLRRLAPLVLERLRAVLGRRDGLQVGTKLGPFDLVTDADREMEDWLWEETSRAFPADGFLGEERGRRSGPGTERDWVVDPIDGTVNFVNGLPWSCCSVGVLAGGAPEAGLVVDPFRGEVFLASPGGATELDGRPVAVAGGGELAGRLVLLEVPSGTSPSALLPAASLVQSADGAVRSMGSGALALATVAAGRAQAVVHLRPSLWDVAAGAALVEHAGGIVLDTAGEWRPAADPGPMVAGSAEVCARFQPLLRSLS